MKLDPSRMALLAMDFQSTILSSLPDTDALVARVAAAISATRLAGGKVAFVRVAFTINDLADFPAHSAMGQRMNGFGEKVLTDAPGTQVDSRLTVQPHDVVVRKTRVGPFSTTNLDEQLRAHGVETLVICGIHTSGCVLTGAREAHDLDYNVVVISDCCADPDEQVHEFLTGTILPKQSTVMTFSDFEQALPSAVSI